MGISLKLTYPLYIQWGLHEWMACQTWWIQKITDRLTLLDPVQILNVNYITERKIGVLQVYALTGYITYLDILWNYTCYLCELVYVGTDNDISRIPQ